MKPNVGFNDCFAVYYICQSVLRSLAYMNYR